MAVGRNDHRKQVVIGSGATLTVEGSLIIYGDLILKEGASLEFLGSGAVADVFGQVRQEGTASIQGAFRDVRGAFK